MNYLLIWRDWVKSCGLGSLMNRLNSWQWSSVIDSVQLWQWLQAFLAMWRPTCTRRQCTVVIMIAGISGYVASNMYKKTVHSCDNDCRHFWLRGLQHVQEDSVQLWQWLQAFQATWRPTCTRRQCTVVTMIAGISGYVASNMYKKTVYTCDNDCRHFWLRGV